MKLLALFWAAAIAFAHGPVHEQIASVTAQIAREPSNARLYLKRGELRRVHQEFNAALADYASAQKLDPDLLEVELCRGRLWLQRQQPAPAIQHLDRFLRAHPANEEALATRAAARALAADARGAVQDYTSAIAAGNPSVDYYLARAEAQASYDVAGALAGIDEGMGKLGSLVTLQELAVTLELKHKNVNGALQRLERMAEQSPRKESYLVRRGEILKEAGRVEEAESAFEQARQAIAALPPNIRGTKAVADLERRATSPRP